MPLTKLIIVGGFLGAGKTTAILALARHLTAAGKKVGIVTNDQGSRLVDTEYLHSQGFPVLEVTGGCFCCNFDQFAEKLSQLQALDFPDYILAEPVGSCTDLIATLMKPLKKHHSAQVALAPLSVVVDPKRLSRFIRDQDNLFPNEVNYLFAKQLEEADLIILNKTDLMEEQDIDVMQAFLQDRYRGIEVLPLSARTGTGLFNWIGQLTSLAPSVSAAPSVPDSSSLVIDYDTYARAEAALGWLNTTANLTVRPPMISCSLCASGVDEQENPIPFSVPAGEVQPADGNDLLLALLETIRQQLADRHQEIAHLKAYLVAGSDWCKISCVSLFDPVEFDHRMSIGFRAATLVLNVRAAADPEDLRLICESAICLHAGQAQADVDTLVTEAFRPSYPQPVHRMA